MTGCTGIMLLNVRSIYKVSVIHRLGMTAATFCLQCYLGRMILRRMRRKVARYAAVTLTTVARQSYRGVRRAVMTGRTAVMNLVVAAARKGRGWIRMTHRTACFDRYITGSHMVHTMIR